METYFANNCSFVAVRIGVKERRSPSLHCIISMIKRFRDPRTPADKERPVRPRTARCEDGIECVVINIQENPQTSIRVRFVRL